MTDNIEFDSLANDYHDNTIKELGKYGKYRDSALLYKSQYVKHTLKNEPKTILDFGCGIGSNIPYLKEFFTNSKLLACDVSSESIKIAEKNYPYCNFQTIKSIEDLKQYKNIDCIFASTVFHHIPPEEHECWIKGLYESMNENSYLFIFEHNMKNPFTKITVKKSQIDKNALMLNSKYCKRLVLNNFYQIKIDGKEIKMKKDNTKLKYTYFFPWRNGIFTSIEHLLYWLPLGAQYCVYTQK